MLSKVICKYCANFDVNPSINYCLCSPYPCPTDYSCCCVDFAGCNSPDLCDCPDCLYALHGRLCLRGYVGGRQSECSCYQSCII